MNLEKLKNLILSLEEVNAKEIKIYVTKTHNPFFDYAIVATAIANRQMDGLISRIAEKENIKIRGIEGRGGSGWLLIDCGFAIVNLFTLDERRRYDLDRIWNNLDEINPVNYETIVKSNN